MTVTNETLQVLPVDTRGRVRVSPERREALLAEFDRSGMTGMAFASWAGIKYSTFSSWIQQRRQAAKASRAENNGVQWVEAVVGREIRSTVVGARLRHLRKFARAASYLS